MKLTQSDGGGNSTAREVHPQCRLVWLSVSELLPHPSYLRNSLAVPVSKLAALRELGDLAFREAIIITRDRIIIDGYARWQIAQECSRKTVLCLEYDLSETEALRWFIQNHFPSRGLSGYSRILLALDLRPALREKALSNQQTGGRFRNSSNLTEAEKVDVRREIAKAAGVSVGNVTKFEQLRLTAVPEVLEALNQGEIRIHKAWSWRKLHPKQQQEQLRLHRLKRDLRQKVKSLIAKHRVETPSSGDKFSFTVGELNDLTQRLRTMLRNDVDEPDPLLITLIDVPGKGVFLTKELFDAISGEQEKT